MSTPAAPKAASTEHPVKQQSDLLPTLFGEGYDAYQIHASNFLISFVIHTVVVALLIWSAYWVTSHREEIKTQITQVFSPDDVSPYVLQPSKTQVGGGGGGGDRDKLQAPKGGLPKQSMQQITPPAVVIRNPNPKLAVEATVVVPPNITLPHSAQLGDPMSGILNGPPSNGTGSGGGIGSGYGGGVGSGRGPGVGPGRGGGIGGGVYRVGGGVTAPRTLYDPEPEYSEEARKARYQGTVVLRIVVGPDGRAHDVHIQRSLGMGLDEKAIETIQKWRFEPSRKDGQAVAVMVDVEINFRLY